MLCKNVTIEIWKCFMKRGVYISVTYILGKESIVAHLASREFEDFHKWMLSLKVSKYLLKVSDVDIFPFRLKKQLRRNASWMPDPEPYINNFLSTSFENTYIYAFQPFIMIWPTTNKLETEAEKRLIIVLMWPTQTRFTRTLELATTTPIIIETTPSARHKQTTPALPEIEVDDHMLFQKQTSINCVLETAPKTISSAWAPRTQRK